MTKTNKGREMISLSLLFCCSNMDTLLLYKRICRKRVMRLKNLFTEGVSFRTFLLNQKPEARALLMKHYIPLDIDPEQRERVNNIKGSVNVLVVVEPKSANWHLILAVLEKLISTNNKIDLKLVTQKDTSGELPKEYQNGKADALLIVFMNEEMEIKGSFASTSNDEDLQEKAVVTRLLDLIEKTV